MLVVPIPLDDDMLSIPSMVENSFSSGVATDEAIVSGLAPGNDACTWIVGYSTVGRSLTGSVRYERTPNTRIAVINSVVVTLRRIKKSVMLIAGSLAPSYRRAAPRRLVRLSRSGCRWRLVLQHPHLGAWH